MWNYTHYDELVHWGVKGMRWGVRRSDGKVFGSLRKSKRQVDDSHDDYNRAHSSKKVSTMSDKELRERNNRLQMERQYAELTKKKSRGKQAVAAFVATATTLAAVTQAASTYKKLGKPVANKILDKVGDFVIKGIDLSGPLTK